MQKVHLTYLETIFGLQISAFAVCLYIALSCACASTCTCKCILSAKFLLFEKKNDTHHLPAIYEHYMTRELEYDAIRFRFLLQILDSPRLFIKNLKVSTVTGQQSQPGYQLCMCRSGLLFIAGADKECQGTREICSQIVHVCPERTPSWTVWTVCQISIYIAHILNMTIILKYILLQGCCCSANSICLVTGKTILDIFYIFCSADTCATGNL